MNQDSADNVQFIATHWETMKAELRRSRAIFDDQEERHWRLDQTECALRQRLKLRPDMSQRTMIRAKGYSNTQAPPSQPHVIETPPQASQELDYEVVDTNGSVKADIEDEEDRNRKVLRSLDLGDEVREVSAPARPNTRLIGIGLQREPHCWVECSRGSVDPW